MTACKPLKITKAKIQAAERNFMKAAQSMKPGRTKAFASQLGDFWWQGCKLLALRHLFDPAKYTQEWLEKEIEAFSVQTLPGGAATFERLAKLMQQTDQLQKAV